MLVRFFEKNDDELIITVTTIVEFSMTYDGHIYMTDSSDRYYNSVSELKSFDKERYNMWTKTLFDEEKLDLTEDLIGKTYVFELEEEEEDEYSGN